MNLFRSFEKKFFADKNVIVHICFIVKKSNRKQVVPRERKAFLPEAFLYNTTHYSRQPFLVSSARYFDQVAIKKGIFFRQLFNCEVLPFMNNNLRKKIDWILRSSLFIA